MFQYFLKKLLKQKEEGFEQLFCSTKPKRKRFACRCPVCLNLSFKVLNALSIIWKATQQCLALMLEGGWVLSCHRELLQSSVDRIKGNNFTILGTLNWLYQLGWWSLLPQSSWCTKAKTQELPSVLTLLSLVYLHGKHLKCKFGQALWTLPNCIRSLKTEDSEQEALKPKVYISKPLVKTLFLAGPALKFTTP